MKVPSWIKKFARELHIHINLVNRLHHSIIVDTCDSFEPKFFTDRYHSFTRVDDVDELFHWALQHLHTRVTLQIVDTIR